MSMFYDAARELRKLANDMEHAHASMLVGRPIPDAGMTLEDAHRDLLCLLGEGAFFSISTELTQMSDRIKVEFKVYDGDKFHKGGTLADVVRNVIEAHRQPAEAADPMAEASKLVVHEPAMAF